MASRRKRRIGVERLEAREQPSAAPLADLNAVGSSGFGFNPWEDVGTSAGGAAYFFATDGFHSPGLYKTDGTAAGTAFVKDMTPAGLPSGTGVPAPAAVVAAGGKAFFAWDDGATGRELWVTDGTAAGTKPVADLVPGAGSSAPAVVGVAGGNVVFLASTKDVGSTGGPPDRLYGTDGTPAGTVALAEFGFGIQPGAFATVDGKVYFAWADNAAPAGAIPQVWATDGTRAGTARVADLPTGTFPADPSGPTGQPGGPVFVRAGKTVYFVAYDQAAGAELWAVGAAGARRVADLNPTKLDGPDGPATFGNGSYPRHLTAVGDTLYFVADDGTNGAALWATDGTAAGTRVVFDPDTAGSNNPTTGFLSNSVAGLVAFSGKLYFSADDGAGGHQLYVTDGTKAGTVRLTSVSHTPAPADGSPPLPGGDPYGEAAVPVATVGSRLVFSIADRTVGRQFWATDGTKAGTAMLKAFSKTDPAGLPYGYPAAGPLDIGVVGGRLLFTANDGATGRQLWATDGTGAGTALVKRVNPGTEGSNPTGFVAAGGKAYFVADNGGGGGVYVTDGAAAPALLKQFGGKYDGPVAWVGAVTETPAELTAVGGTVFFVVRAGAYGRQLWGTDGTAAGTRLLLDLPSDVTGYSFSGQPSGVDNLTAAGGTLFFTVDAKGAGQTVWTSDGTKAGTRKVARISSAAVADNDYSGPGGPTAPGPLVAAGGRVFFAAADGTYGSEVWVSDGTAAGTKMVADLGRATTYGKGGATDGSGPADFTVLNGTVYFTASPNGNGRELWATDGTEAGTRRVTILTTAGGFTSAYRSSAAPAPRQMAAAGGKLYLAVYEANSAGLWVSDGTAAGTKLLTTAEVSPAIGVLGGPPISQLTPAGDRLYFARSEGAAGRQLWATDGTPAGTKSVRPIAVPKSVPNGLLAGGTTTVEGTLQILTAVGNRVLLAADDGKSGTELWVSDGTAAGTKQVQDLNPGKADGVQVGYEGTPGAVVVGGRVVFAGVSARAGVEPWTLPVSDVQPASPPVSPPTSPPVSPPVVPPPVPPPVSPPVSPPTPPVTTPRPVAPGVVRTFPVKATEGAAFNGNLASVSRCQGFPRGHTRGRIETRRKAVPRDRGGVNPAAVIPPGSHPGAD